MEKADLTLEDYYEERRSLTPKQAVHIFEHLTLAVHYLHHMNPPFVHGDIRPSNILIFDAKASEFRAKLADFDRSQRGWLKLRKERADRQLRTEKDDLHDLAHVTERLASRSGDISLLLSTADILTAYDKKTCWELLFSKLDALRKPFNLVRSNVEICQTGGREEFARTRISFMSEIPELIAISAAVSNVDILLELLKIAPNCYNDCRNMGA